eukprot:6031429-Pyramimonas_sp.AAC.1
MSIAASAAIDARGIARRILRTDQEPAAQALAEQISAERKLKGSKCQLTAALARGHSSMGFVEAMNDQVAMQVR